MMPYATTGETVVLTHSGWGDGWYPVRLTRDAASTPLALHIDLLVVGYIEEDEEDGACLHERRTAERSVLRGMKGRLRHHMTRSRAAGDEPCGRTAAA